MSYMYVCYVCMYACVNTLCGTHNFIDTTETLVVKAVAIFIRTFISGRAGSAQNKLKNLHSTLNQNAS